MANFRSLTLRNFAESHDVKSPWR